MTQIEYFVDQTLSNSGLISPEYFIEKHDLQKLDRHIEPKMLRQELMHRLKQKRKGLALSSIGKLSNRDHATVIHSCRVIENLKGQNDEYYTSLLEKYGKELDQINFNA